MDLMLCNFFQCYDAFYSIQKLTQLQKPQIVKNFIRMNFYSDNKIFIIFLLLSKNYTLYHLFQFNRFQKFSTYRQLLINSVLMEDQRKSLIVNTFFPCCKRNFSVRVCTSKDCSFSAFICQDKQCQCNREKHANCTTRNITQLLQKVEKQKKQINQNMQKSIDHIIQIYENIIEKFSQDKIKFSSLLETFGLGQQTKQFINMISFGQFDEIKGNFVHKVIEQEGVVVNWNKTEEDIINFWENHKQQIQNFRKDLYNIDKIYFPAYYKILRPFTDVNQWKRILIRADDKFIDLTYGGLLTANDIDKMKIKDIAFSDSQFTPVTQYSWYFENVQFKTILNLPINQLIANVFNGKTPTGTQWSASYDKGYLYYAGTIRTYGPFNSFYQGCNWSNHVQIGSQTSLRTGGGAHHTGQFIHSACNGYSQKQYSITNKIGWKNKRVFWIR